MPVERRVLKMSSASSGLKRKSYFVDESVVQRAKKLIRAETDSDTIRTALDRLVEQEELWKFMEETGGKLPPGSIEEP
jgi:hypothetical protein